MLRGRLDIDSFIKEQIKVIMGLLIFIGAVGVVALAVIIWGVAQLRKQDTSLR